MPDDLASLHRLLDLPPEASPAILRFAYDQQMGVAVRSNNHHRALELSAALDALPPALREAIYPTMSTRVPGQALSTGPARTSNRRTARPRRGVSFRGVLVILLLTVGVGGWAFWRATHPTLPTMTVSWPDTSAPPGVTAPAPSPYARSARSDARFVITAVQQCRQAHEVPVTAFRQVGHQLSFRCRGTVSRVFLKPGDVATVVHAGRRLIAEVTAPDGETAQAALHLGRTR